MCLQHWQLKNVWLLVFKLHLTFETFQYLDRKNFIYQYPALCGVKFSIKHLNLVCAALQGWGGGWWWPVCGCWWPCPYQMPRPGTDLATRTIEPAGGRRRWTEMASLLLKGKHLQIFLWAVVTTWYCVFLCTIDSALKIDVTMCCRSWASQSRAPQTSKDQTDSWSQHPSGAWRKPRHDSVPGVLQEPTGTSLQLQRYPRSVRLVTQPEARSVTQ